MGCQAVSPRLTVPVGLRQPPASGFASDTEACLLIRADARVMGATVKGWTARDDRIRSHAARLPCACYRCRRGVGGVRIEARDGAAITDVAKVEIVGIEDAEAVVVDAD